jgi:hypothetical protein
MSAVRGSNACASDAPIIFLGTSPLVLCHALTVRRSGRSVRILDAAESPGGAWRTIEAFGFRNVEAAVHLIENRPTVYHALEKFGVPLEQSSQSVGLSIGQRLVPLGWSRLLAFAGVGTKALLRRDTGRAQTAFAGLRRALRDRRTPFLYPARGASAITNQLLRALHDLGVEPEFGVTANHAEFSASAPHGLTTSIGTLPFSTLAISSRAHCALIRDGKLVELSAARTSLQCLALLVEGPAPRFEYVEFLVDYALRRARNLSCMVEPSPPSGLYVLSVQLVRPVSSAPETVQRAAEIALARLCRAGVMDQTTRICEIHNQVFEISTIPDRVMQRLNVEQSEWIRAHRTTDFAEELCSTLACATPTPLKA